MSLFVKLKYRGRLSHPDKVFPMLLEMEDICRANGWKYHAWDEDWDRPATLNFELENGTLLFEGHAPVKGITFNPGKEYETVWLTFDRHSVLQSLFTLNQPVAIQQDADIPWHRVKTCFDGPVTHISLCKLFKFLSDKYFDYFDVQDETGYWAHRDDQKLANWVTDKTEAMSLMNEEINALMADQSIDKETRRAIMYDLFRIHGENFKSDE
jgi:hypothetical protein